jgi:hypothetical protein
VHLRVAQPSVNSTGGSGCERQFARPMRPSNFALEEDGSCSTKFLADGPRQAFDPRDHIFALLGLVKKSFYNPFEPDYAQPSTWAF